MRVNTDRSNAISIESQPTMVHIIFVKGYYQLQHKSKKDTISLRISGRGDVFVVSMALVWYVNIILQEILPIPSKKSISY